jgi:CubicO group peptidase (beta-lactamase class C family)
VALVARKGRVAYFESFGLQDKASGAPMANDAIFRIYSMTKPLVSVAAIMLMEDGRLVLHGPRLAPPARTHEAAGQRSQS